MVPIVARRNHFAFPNGLQNRRGRREAHPSAMSQQENRALPVSIWRTYVQLTR